MARHTIYLDNAEFRGDEVVISGDEARHAVRVKRVRSGDNLRLVDGCGTVMTTEVLDAGRDLVLKLLETRRVPRPTPRLEVWSATPKGARLDRMVDGLCQVGAASWIPTTFGRSVVDPRSTKLERLERIVTEAVKQCGRPWLMEIGGRSTFADAIDAPSEVAVVVADASGDAPMPQAGKEIRLLIGPEGGLTDQEISHARDAGAQICRFGSHTMRTEVAAMVAAAILLAHQSQPME